MSISPIRTTSRTSSRRLAGNRSLVELLISTDTAAKAARLRGAAGQVHVVPPESSPLRWLVALLHERAGEAAEIVGHLRDDGADRDGAALDFQLTALLGGRHAMLDAILGAFARDPGLGLVFPCDPVLRDPAWFCDYPTAGMFWARQATLAVLAGWEATARDERLLPEACAVAGLGPAMVHVPGVLV